MEQNTTMVFGIMKYFEDDYPADNSTTEITSTEVTTTEILTFFLLPDVQKLDWKNHKILDIFIVLIIFGSMMNLLLVLSFYMTRILEKIGNGYMMAQSMGDLAITLVVMPLLITYITEEAGTSSVNVNYCMLLHLFTEISVYAYGFFSALTSLGWAVFRKQARLMKNYIEIPVKIVVPTIVLICTIVVIIGIYTGMEFDFCKREHHGNIYYRAATNLIMYVMPSITSLYISLNTFSKLGRTRNIEIFKRNYRRRHFPILEITLFNNCLFIFCWAPYLLTIYIYPDVNKILYTFLVFLGLARSSVSATLYGLFNKYYRRAYCSTFVQIISFNFQCCMKAPQGLPTLSAADIHLIPLFELQEQFRLTGRRPIGTTSVTTL